MKGPVAIDFFCYNTHVMPKLWKYRQFASYKRYSGSVEAHVGFYLACMEIGKKQ